MRAKKEELERKRLAERSPCASDDDDDDDGDLKSRLLYYIALAAQRFSLPSYPPWLRAPLLRAPLSNANTALSTAAPHAEPE